MLVGAPCGNFVHRFITLLTFKNLDLKTLSFFLFLNYLFDFNFTIFRFGAVASCTPSQAPPSLSFLPLLPDDVPEGGKKDETISFCVDHVLTGADKFHAASSPREDQSFSACIHTRSHQLRRTV